MRLVCVALLAWMTVGSLSAAEPKPTVSGTTQPAAEEDFGAQLKPTPVLDLAAARKAIRVVDGFQVELVAAEPLVASPVAMSFDADGRLYVAEMRDYPESPEAQLGRIRLLEDTDGDGRFDKSSVFVEGLSWPTSVVCYDGGVFIAAAPDILFCKDTNADGRADVRDVVFTGFGRSNVQGLLNSLTWGLDNRIHGATSSAGAQVRPGDAPHAAQLVLSGRDFSFDLRSLKLQSESGGGQHGLTFDDWGRKFVCSNSDHIQAVMCEDRYLARNPRAEAPSPRVSIAEDGPQAEVFRTSPIEAWRILRTRLRVAGAVPGPIEGGGRPAGYFTGATGITIYRGDAWPEKYRGQAFVGDVGSNLVHRKRISRAGVGFTARRIDESSEFLTSSDIWFRPVGFANAPDGTLYVMDMCRETIEHPASLPPQIKKHLDLASGRERGRIYRIVPQGFKQPKLPKLSSVPIGELVAKLESQNGWSRDTAARLLYERQDPAAVEGLVKLANTSESALARLYALHALDGLAALDEASILESLGDAEPKVREHAVRLAETLIASSSDVREALLKMTGDDDLRVRYQLAFTLGEVSGADRNRALARLAMRNPADPWLRVAIWSSLSNGADEVLSQLLGNQELSRTSAGLGLLAAVARQVAMQDGQNGVAAALVAVANPTDNRALVSPAASAAVIRGLMQGQGGGGKFKVPPKLAGQFEQILSAARDLVVDSDKAADERAEAIGLLALLPPIEARKLYSKLLRPAEPPVVQFSVLKTLRGQTDDASAAVVIEAWPTLSPQVRGEALETLFSRAKWFPPILSAIEAGTISPAEIDPARIKAFAMHKDANLRARAAKLFDSGGAAKRPEVVDAYRKCLETAGDPTRGKAVYQKHCAACHKAEGVGHEIGPNLAALRNRGAEAILIGVLDPNREVNPQYVNYLVATKAGRLLTGLVAGESAASITLRRGEGASDTVLRADVEELRSSGVSLMPEGFEKQIDAAAMADLIAYLLSLK